MNRKQRRAAEKARRSPAYPPKPGANAASDAPHATIAGMDSNGKTIGLCMIVKNESEVILRCLESVRPIVDYVLIEDTGSTDGTQAIIREWLDRTGLPGEVYDKPWQDFAYNRSHALARLRENKGVDYAFMIDADDQLVVEAGFDAAMFKQSLSQDLYKVPLRQGLVHYLVNQICSNKVEFRYRGVLHEFIEGPEGFSSGTAAGFYILSGREGARSKDPDKYRKDARVLEQALQAEQDAFLRSRYTFYLARSYRDAGEKEKALDNYLKRAKLGYWTEEVFESLYGAAELLKAMGRPLDEVIAMYLRASDAVPSRAEALHAASRLCRENSKFADGFEYARRGLKIPQPAAGLFVQSWVYDYGLLDEFAINAYWTGRYAESADACDRLLNEGKLPAEMRDRVEKNKDFAVSKQQEIAASSSPEPDAFLKLLGAAREKEKLGRPNEEVITTYVDATAACPTRAEALHGAARFCRNKGLHERGYEFAAQGLTIAYPNNSPAVEDWIYEYGLLDELAVNAYWTAKYAECTDACDRLLSEGKLPTEKRDRVLKNKQFAIDKLAEKNAPRSMTLRPTWVPEAPAAGTELMVAGLRERIGQELERINLQVNHPGHDKADKRPRVVWMHHHVNQRWVQWCKDKELVDSVTCFVFVSYWQREQYLNAFGLPPQRCVVLRNALTVSPDLRHWEAGSKWRCAYTSTPFRGLSVLLDAWERLSPANAELHIWSSMKLYLEDDGPYRHLYARAESMPGVIYHGIAPNPELRAALQSMHFLVYPCTFEETACLAVIEAMAAGCRVICPSLGALPETTGKFARLYPFLSDPADHAKSFAEVLTEEIRNPWGGNLELAEEQQNYARETYDWSVRVAEWKAFIDLACKRENLLPTTASSSPESDAFLKLLHAAREKEKLGRPDDEVIAVYMKATAACPTRAEALHGAARFCRNNGLHERGYEFAAQGLAIAYPKDAPALEDWIYEYGLLDELAVNAYWTARYPECVDACNRLLNEGRLPTEKRDRVLKNKQFAIDKMAVNPNNSMFQSLVRLRDLGFAPTGILDVGAHEGHFSRGARKIFEAAHILMIDALAEKAPVLADVCRELGNADHLIAMLGDREMEATSFFVVNTEVRRDLVKTGSSKYKENANFPMEERALPQRTLRSIVADRALPFQLLKLDVQGAELDVLRGLGDELSKVEVILMEMSLVDYNKGAPLIDVVLSELSGMGFVLYDIVEEHRHLGGCLLQIDGLFVRPTSRLRRHPPFWS